MVELPQEVAEEAHLEAMAEAESYAWQEEEQGEVQKNGALA